jgi:hypothetical protein
MEVAEIEDEISSRIKKQLNDQYQGRFSSAVDLDYDNRRSYFCVTFTNDADFPSIGEFVDEIVEELGIKEPYLKADLRRDENTYEVSLIDRDIL